MCENVVLILSLFHTTVSYQWASVTRAKWNNSCPFYNTYFSELIQKVSSTFIISMFCYRIDMLNPTGSLFTQLGFDGSGNGLLLQ